MPSVASSGHMAAMPADDAGQLDRALASGAVPVRFGGPSDAWSLIGADVLPIALAACADPPDRAVDRRTLMADMLDDCLFAARSDLVRVLAGHGAVSSRRSPILDACRHWSADGVEVGRDMAMWLADAHSPPGGKPALIAIGQGLSRVAADMLSARPTTGHAQDAIARALASGKPMSEVIEAAAPIAWPDMKSITVGLAMADPASIRTAIGLMPSDMIVKAPMPGTNPLLVALGDLDHPCATLPVVLDAIRGRGLSIDAKRTLDGASAIMATKHREHMVTLLDHGVDPLHGPASIMSAGGLSAGVLASIVRARIEIVAAAVHRVASDPDGRLRICGWLWSHMLSDGPGDPPVTPATAGWAADIASRHMDQPWAMRLLAACGRSAT